MKKLLIIMAIFLAGMKVQAQKTADLGLTTGLAFYWGDVQQVDYMKSLSPAFGVFARWNMNKRMAVKAQLMIASLNVKGIYNDVYLSQPGMGFTFPNSLVYHYPRDLSQYYSFHRSIQMLEGIFEFNFKDYELGNKNASFTPYISAGIGAMYTRANGSGTLILNQQPRIPQNGNLYYNAYVDENGHTTNGLDAFSPVIPVGMGIKWNISDIFAINVEAMVRKTFTDNIDNLDDPIRFHYFDTSQVPDPTDPTGNRQMYAGYADKFSSSTVHNNDWLSTFTVSFIILLWDGKKNCPVYD
ncbi:DUF6089 family protein [Prolixibacter sp. NT017]|uniref:DUF6089 family protein n=1 Tax=Prolixibacter sp. NT017 TaxID=2652390 RepID=UPI0012766282|nr:DUF6089 family protein [Prolixibacter sp. NT017]GET26240.1 hypothetical protein NT017_25690 [Prolixibacter sp. NT017]